MLAIYKREVRSYFQSMVGCVFVAFSYCIYRNLLYGI